MSQFGTAEQDRIPLIHKLNLGLGMNPALVGLLGALPRLTDAITDPLMGFISDNSSTRWGRRRPFIFVGAILSGIIFIFLWQLPPGQSESYYFWYFLIGSFVFYLAYTIFATPWVALGYELTPDYHERTRLMAVQNFMGSLAYVISPWFLWVMQLDYFDDVVDGAANLAIIIGIFTIIIGIMPALILRERFRSEKLHGAVDPDAPKVTLGYVIWKNIKKFVSGFVVTLKVKPFLLLCLATFLVFNGFILIASFQTYVIIYYVFAGNQELGAEWAGYSGTVGAVSSFIVIFIVTWMSTKFGKRRAFFIAIGISILGYALKWVCYNPEIPWLLLLPSPLMAFGLGALFTLMGSMIADVCDYDEINTHERREGMFGSIYWWVVKLGMALALAGGGYLLNATGFDVELEGNQTEQAIYLMRLFDVLIPVISSAIAIWAVAMYPITEDMAHEMREKLEARRGTTGGEDKDEPMVGTPQEA